MKYFELWCRLQRSLEFCIGMQGRRLGVTRLGYMKVEMGQDAIITGAAECR
jgi:hypothetical protein